MPTLAPWPVGSPLARGDQQPQPVLVEGDVLAFDGHELGAAQRRGVAEQQQRAVALADQTAVAGRDQPADFRGGEGRGLAGGAAVFALNAAQRVADRRVRGRPGLPGKPVGAAECRETPHQGAAAVREGERGEIGRDGFRGGRQGRPAGVAAPRTKMLPVGAVGAQGGRRQGLSGEIDRGGQGGQRRCRWRGQDRRRPRVAERCRCGGWQDLRRGQGGLRHRCGGTH
jgi:hypothetical protein